MRRAAELAAVHGLAVLAIAALCSLIYSNSLAVPFVFDDLHNIRSNPHLRVPDLGLEALRRAGFESPSSSRPLANISFALNYYLWGDDVRSFHVVNIAIHALSGILVYAIALVVFRQSRGRQRPPGERAFAGMAAVAALLFVVHPLQTQSVTYIVQRMNSLAAMFYLLAFWLYLRGRLAAVGWRRGMLWSGTLLAWILSLGSKQTAVTLPFMVLLYEWFFFQDLDRAWLQRAFWPFVAACAATAGLAWLYLEGSPSRTIDELYAIRDFTMGERLLTQFRVLVFYLALLLYPHPGRLNLSHHMDPSHSLLDPPSTLLALLAVLGLGVVAVLLARTHRLVSFCILWFFGNLALESSVIGLEMIFEHRLYLPMFGVSLIATALLFELLAARRSWAIAISVAAIAALAAAAHVRNEVWRDPVTLWSDAVAKNPHDVRPHNSLGVALVQQGRIAEAIEHYQEALRIDPDSTQAHINLGSAYGAQGRLGRAIHHFREALRINPDSARAHNNLGAALAQRGRLEPAIRHFEAALELRPDYSGARKNLERARASSSR